jgi:hypothetical protein
VEGLLAAYGYIVEAAEKIASKFASECEGISEINTGICIDDNADNYHLTFKYIGY